MYSLDSLWEKSALIGLLIQITISLVHFVLILNKCRLNGLKLCLNGIIKFALFFLGKLKQHTL